MTNFFFSESHSFVQFSSKYMLIYSEKQLKDIKILMTILQLRK